MDISALQPSIKASEIPFEQLAANKNVPEREKVVEASRQFEAVLLRQILQQARKPLLDSGQANTSTSAGIYDDMINNQLADKISRSGTFGLAHSLEGQLVHQVLPDAGKAAEGKANIGAAVCPVKTSGAEGVNKNLQDISVVTAAQTSGGDAGEGRGLHTVDEVRARKMHSGSARPAVKTRQISRF